MGRGKDSERSLTNYCHGQNRLDLGKINLSPVKAGLDSEKQRQTGTSPLSQTQLHFFISDSSASLKPQAAQVDGK